LALPDLVREHSQSDWLEKFNLLHLSTGDMLRAEITAGTELGKKMSLIMSKGELVPDEGCD